jgi:hypothetical protein
MTIAGLFVKCNTLYSLQKGKNHLRVNDSILTLREFEEA